MGLGAPSSHSASHVIWATRVPRCRYCAAHQQKSNTTQSALPSQTSRTPGFLWSQPRTRHKGPADMRQAHPTDLSTWKPKHVWARSPVVSPPWPMPQARDSHRLLPWRTYWPPPRAGYHAESRARADTDRWEPRGASRRPPSSGQYASLPLRTHTIQELWNPEKWGRTQVTPSRRAGTSGRGEGTAEEAGTLSRAVPPSLEGGASTKSKICVPTSVAILVRAEPTTFRFVKEPDVRGHALGVAGKHRTSGAGLFFFFFFLTLQQARFLPAAASRSLPGIRISEKCVYLRTL